MNKLGGSFCPPQLNVQCQAKQPSSLPGKELLNVDAVAAVVGTRCSPMSNIGDAPIRKWWSISTASLRELLNFVDKLNEPPMMLARNHKWPLAT